MNQVLILLLSAVICVTAMRRIKLPPILGYLLIGASLGPHGLAWIQASHVVEMLSELGIVFLLFAIGLEMHLPQFLAMRSVLLRLGFWQMGLCTLVAALILRYLGLPWIGAVIAGGALALSSTAILLKQLKDQQELGSPIGRLSFGLLIFQDLAAIPFLIAIPVLASGTEPKALVLALSMAFLKGLLALVAILWLGRKTLGMFFAIVAKARSSEVFMLAVLWVALAAAAITQNLGLSMSMGAFLAGVVLGDSKFRHQVSSDIRPFRDMLLGLFFVSVGLGLNLKELFYNGTHILLGLFLLCVIKGVVHFVLGWHFSGRNIRDGARFGVIMAHSGEFGILLLSLAAKEHLIPHEWAQQLLAILVLSLFLAVFLVKYNVPWTRFLKSWGPQPIRNLPEPEPVPEQGVIICGFGRVGQILARFFKKMGIPYVALDLDPTQVTEAATAGERVYFGDATQREVLISIGLNNARLVVLCVDDVVMSEQILRAVRHQSPEIPVIVRTRDDAALDVLQEAGATEVVPEILEASLMLVSHVLIMLGFSSEQVFGMIQEAKGDRYRLLKGFFESEHDPVTVDANQELRHAIVLLPGSQALGQSIQDLSRLDIWQRVTLDELVRDQKALDELDPNLILEEQDVLVVMGDPADMAECERWLLAGKNVT